MTVSLATISQRMLSWMHEVPVKTLHKSLCGLMIVWLLFSAAQLVGLFIPDSSTDKSLVAAVAPPAGKSAGHSRVVDISQLQSLELFGVAGAQAAPVVVAPVDNKIEDSATKTALDLSLEGIVHNLNAADSVAVIVYKGKQEAYLIGEKLPVGGQVTLAKVLLDHVIIDNRGSYESLWLYDDVKKGASTSRSRSRPSSSSAKANTNDMRRNSQVTEVASDYRKRLYKNPASLASALRISPAQRGGKMLGYRVSPGKDREQFAQFGFKANDVVTSVNGIDLDEPSKALEIYKLMRTAKEANFTVDRNGASVDIMVSLGE